MRFPSYWEHSAGSTVPLHEMLGAGVGAGVGLRVVGAGVGDGVGFGVVGAADGATVGAQLPQRAGQSSGTSPTQAEAFWP